MMRKYDLIVILSLLVLLAMAHNHRYAGADENKPQKSASEESKLLRHVVLFRFKKDAPESKIREIEREFAQLPQRIEQIRDFEWGVDESPEGLADGFTHCFVVTFDEADQRDAYLPHPAHQDFVALLKPYLDKALVVDYQRRE